MSLPYHPPQRTVIARLLTPAGWVEGTIHLPVKTRLLDHLEHTRDFISMTDVRHVARPEVVPFFALRKASVSLVVPDEVEGTAALERRDLRPTNGHALVCLLERGHVSGTIEIPMRLRVSDQLVHGAPFLVVRHARARMLDPWLGAAIDVDAPVVFVNTHNVVGVSEIEP